MQTKWTLTVLAGLTALVGITAILLTPDHPVSDMSGVEAPELEAGPPSTATVGPPPSNSSELPGEQLPRDAGDELKTSP